MALLAGALAWLAHLGPGAFVEIARDYDDFARAFRRKLYREIVPQVADTSPRAPRVRAGNPSSR